MLIPDTFFWVFAGILARWEQKSLKDAREQTMTSLMRRSPKITNQTKGKGKAVAKEPKLNDGSSFTAVILITVMNWGQHRDDFVSICFGIKDLTSSLVGEIMALILLFCQGDMILCYPWRYILKVHSISPAILSESIWNLGNVLHCEQVDRHIYQCIARSHTLCVSVKEYVQFERIVIQFDPKLYQKSQSSSRNQGNMIIQVLSSPWITLDEILSYPTWDVHLGRTVASGTW